MRGGLILRRKPALGGEFSWPPGSERVWPGWGELTEAQRAAATTLGQEEEDWPPEAADSDDDQAAWGSDGEDDDAFAVSAQVTACLWFIGRVWPLACGWWVSCDLLLCAGRVNCDRTRRPRRRRRGSSHDFFAFFACFSRVFFVSSLVFWI